MTKRCKEMKIATKISLQIRGKVTSTSPMKLRTKSEAQNIESYIVRFQSVINKDEQKKMNKKERMEFRWRFKEVTFMPKDNAWY